MRAGQKGASTPATTAAAAADGMLPVFEDRAQQPHIEALKRKLSQSGGGLGALLEASTRKTAKKLKVSARIRVHGQGFI